MENIKVVRANNKVTNYSQSYKKILESMLKKIKANSKIEKINFLQSDIEEIYINEDKVIDRNDVFMKDNLEIIEEKTELPNITLIKGVYAGKPFTISHYIDGSHKIIGDIEVEDQRILLQQYERGIFI